MTAHEDPELIDFLLNCTSWAGAFLAKLAEAALRADTENYPVLRPALLSMKRKYPDFAVPFNAIKRPKAEPIQ